MPAVDLLATDHPATRHPRHPSWRPAGVAALAAGGLAVVATVDPNEPGRYPACPFLAVTGHWCPGCGSLRALHAVTRGDVLSAVASNVLTAAAVPLLAWLWVRWAHRTRTGAAQARPAPAVVLWAGAIMVVAFGIVRNLPIGAALAP